MVFTKKKLKPVVNEENLIEGAIKNEYWFTGKMIESVTIYPNFKTRTGKLTNETRGKEVCLVPEIRHIPVKSCKQFATFYTIKKKVDDEMVEETMSRQDYLREKGWIPLEECTEEIQKMVKTMHNYNQKEISNAVPGKEVYKPSA